MRLFIKNFVALFVERVARYTRNKAILSILAKNERKPTRKVIKVQMGKEECRKFVGKLCLAMRSANVE